MIESWIIFGLLSAVFAALVAIFGKIGLSEIDSTIATTVRAVIMAGFFVIVSFALNKFRLLSSLNGKALTFIALSGVAGALSWLFYFVALKRGPALGVVAMDRLSIAFVLVLAALFLGEGFTWRSVLGACFVVAGAVLITLN